MQVMLRPCRALLGKWRYIDYLANLAPFLVPSYSTGSTVVVPSTNLQSSCMRYEMPYLYMICHLVAVAVFCTLSLICQTLCAVMKP